jgi:hypothetical protein
MVETIHATGKFRPFVATVVTAWLDEHGKLQIDWQVTIYLYQFTCHLRLEQG